MVYFGHIAAAYRDPKSYEEAARKAFTDEAHSVSQISQQVWANSKVASRKHAAVKEATWFLGGTILIAFIGIIAALYILTMA